MTSKYSAGALVGALMLAVGFWSYPANALTFHFSFTDSNNGAGFVPGTITGDITGLAADGLNQQAAGVFVTSFPAGLNITLSPAFNFVTAPDVTSNSFNVSGGVITSLIFDARTDTGVPFTELTLTFPTSRLANFQVDEIDDRVSLGPLIIPPVSEVPLPAALPLFATGLGALGLFEWEEEESGGTRCVNPTPNLKSGRPPRDRCFCLFVC